MLIPIDISNSRFTHVQIDVLENDAWCRNCYVTEYLWHHEHSQILRSLRQLNIKDYELKSLRSTYYLIHFLFQCGEYLVKYMKKHYMTMQLAQYVI